MCRAFSPGDAWDPFPPGLQPGLVCFAPLALGKGSPFPQAFSLGWYVCAPLALYRIVVSQAGTSHKRAGIFAASTSTTTSGSAAAWGLRSAEGGGTGPLRSAEGAQHTSLALRARLALCNLCAPWKGVVQELLAWRAARASSRTRMGPKTGSLACSGSRLSAGTGIAPLYPTLHNVKRPGY